MPKVGRDGPPLKPSIFTSSLSHAVLTTAVPAWPAMLNLQANNSVVWLPNASAPMAELRTGSWHALLVHVVAWRDRERAVGVLRESRHFPG